MTKIILKSAPRKTTIRRSVVRKVIAEVFGIKPKASTKKSSTKSTRVSIGRRSRKAA